MSASEIVPHLYVGGLAALAQVGTLGVSRLLSLGVPPPPGSATVPPLADSACLCCELEDSEEADLLALLPRAVDFAASAARDGCALLIACHAGVSRSAAVAAGVLMASSSLGRDAALDLLRSRHAAAAPNDGFLTQLQLWEAMDCRLDPENSAYRQWGVQRAASALASGSGEAVSASLLAQLGQAPSAGALLRCRACRRLLATAEHVVEHERGAGEQAFRRRGTQTTAAQPCGSFFLQPMAWMGATLADGAVSGKLCCPSERCGARLGAFSWAGERCSCGAWVLPAFQLHCSRVDSERVL